MSEFKCRCSYPDCQVTYLSSDLVKSLQDLRYRVGPLTVLSGYRCQLHNRDAGGSDNSFHKLGLAADLAAKKIAPLELRKEAEQVPMFANGGIGTYKTFIHVDVRPFKARWSG